jgi:hypothetical protein
LTRLYSIVTPWYTLKLAKGSIKTLKLPSSLGGMSQSN